MPENGAYVHPEDLPRPADHDERMAVARRAAEWHLGDSSWAGEIIAAYFYPRAVADALDRDRADVAGPGGGTGPGRAER